MLWFYFVFSKDCGDYVVYPKTLLESLPDQ